MVALPPNNGAPVRGCLSEIPDIVPVDLLAIKRVHGGNLYDGGRRWVGPGPGHSRADRSLSVCISETGRLLIHSFAGDSFAECAAFLGVENTDAAKMDRATRDQLSREREAETSRRREFCQALLREANPIEGSLAARYLEARGIRWCPADLAFHPGARRGYRSMSRAPALLAIARSKSGSLAGVQATFLRPDGCGHTGRTSFGSIRKAAVWLAPAEPVLAVGEGVETCASFSTLHDVPTWATLGTGGLEAFEPPPCVRRLVVAADGDDAGRQAAYALADRMRRRCAVTIMSAPLGTDWNDMARHPGDV
jgi:putative DNA primase/helicase